MLASQETAPADVSEAAPEVASPEPATEAPALQDDDLISTARALATDAGAPDSTFPEELTAELAARRAEVAAALAEAEAARLAAEASRDAHLRLAADYDNFRRRSAAERAELQDAASVKVLERLLPLLDSLDGADLLLGGVSEECEPEPSPRADLDAESLSEALASVTRQARKLFRDAGLERVVAVGQPFDPNTHDAVMREPSADVPDGTVLQEFRAGYTLNGKLLRAAMVKVSHEL